MLLTAYSDTEAAIRAINEIKLHHYLLKPWDPPEQNLYPVLDDLLDDWLGSYRAAFRRLAGAGHALVAPRPTSCASFWRATRCPTSGWMWRRPTAIRKCGAPWTWLPPEERHFPVVLLPDGGRLSDPSHAEVAGAHRVQDARRCASPTI